MSDEPVILNMFTSLDIPVERVVNGLVENKDELNQLLALGFNKDGVLVSYSSTADIGIILELLESFKYNLLSGEYRGEP